MRFNSKAHMAQELMAGKQFTSHLGGVIHYDPDDAFTCPFRYGDTSIGGVWELYCKDIWTEIAPRHAHQDHINAYQKGQAWQYTQLGMGGVYQDCKTNGEWVRPDWYAHVEYRLHPHNALIQEHNKGAKIQAYICGAHTDQWEDVGDPCWFDDIEYRIKPYHAHQDLIDSYQEGQAWQCTVPNMDGRYADCGCDGEWTEPAWDERITYRLHPHNALIQEYNKGANIQAYVDALDAWVDQYNPDWGTDVQYRVKPATKVVYEWVIKSIEGWVTISVLMTDDEAKERLGGREYNKTGRAWVVEA